MPHSGSERGTSSLDVVAEEVRREREAQLSHFDSLDAKAGIVLGFAGAVAALISNGGAVALAARTVSVLAALMALGAFWPRQFEITDVRALRDKYLGAHARFTLRILVDTHIAMLEHTATLLHRKARRLRFSMAGLVLAAVLTLVAGATE